jgi:hypothetical protein
MEVFCYSNDPYPRTQCAVEWPGTDMNGYSSRIKARDDIAPACVLHEAMHLDLFQGDYETYCVSHKEECGWNEKRLEELNELFASGAL